VRIVGDLAIIDEPPSAAVAVALRGVLCTIDTTAIDASLPAALSAPLIEVTRVILEGGATIEIARRDGVRLRAAIEQYHARIQAERDAVQRHAEELVRTFSSKEES